MSTFIAFLFMAALIAVIVFLVLGIMNVIKKNGRAKRTFLYSGAAFIATIILAVTSPDAPAVKSPGPTETVQTPVSEVSQPTASIGDDQPGVTAEQTTATDKQVQGNAEQQKTFAENQIKKDEAKSAAQAKIKAAEKAKSDAAAKTEADKKAAEAEQETAAAKAKVAKEAATNAIPGTIGMTPDQFRTAFNKSSTEIGMDMHLPKLNISSGAVQNTFQYMLSDNIALTGTINKADSSIREINLLGQTAGSYEESANYLLAMGLIMKAVDPRATKEDNAAKMRKLGLMDENLELANLNKQATIDGLKYSISYLDGIGLMFYVNDENDK
ncbi:hypothetical protein [Paenibacillus bovis]|uniref:Uncharacterized protein n=1 Tax=Paenibacillus bovis TaxID=1616788 RepID=A0A172ZEF4_9BACL|nr:hypothetical protein [Paenibacillus bovis]ANF95657.1 hypothetical protein AR543_06350 [Paenibacillus bovis]